MTRTSIPAKDAPTAGAGTSPPPLVTEMLLLPNGSLLVHNLTPTFAALLADLDFNDGKGRIRTPLPLPAEHCSPLPSDAKSSDSLTPE